MKTWVILLFLVLLPGKGLTVEASFTDPEDRVFPSDYQDVDTHHETGQGIRKYAEDAQSGPQKNFGVQTVHDNKKFAVFRGDRFEYQSKEGKDSVLWDVQAWAGWDYNKVYLESEGTWLIDGEEVEEAELEVLYGRNIATFWDLKAGVRHDFKPEPSRTFFALGFQGLAPYWFEVDATAYVSQDGDVSGALEAEYDLLLSQRLILQPRLETSVAIQRVEKYGVGQGFNHIELGARLRYEIRREFAPYVGVSWSRKLGETADLAEAGGEDIGAVSFVAGIRFWF